MKFKYMIKGREVAEIGLKVKFKDKEREIKWSKKCKTMKTPIILKKLNFKN